MCPPSTDPIRPVGPVSGDVYVARAELASGVHRREREDGDPEEQRRRRRHQHRQPAPGEAWVDPGTLDPGTYDDHGRAHVRDEDELPPHRHIDATA